MRPLIVDVDAGIAFSSRQAERRILDLARPADARNLLTAIAATERSWLIATSDAWLRTIAGNREVLAAAFERILHPGAAALDLCLDKARFAHWCALNELPAPRLHAAADILVERSGSAVFPLLLRPSVSQHATGRRLPKAIEVRDAREARHWLDVFASEGVEPLITASLLGRRLTQSSVGASRRDGSLMTFVAAKRRPLPEHCAVGTYVELFPDEAIEALARRALEALDFSGIGEVEILRDEDAGRDYLIEINARPWIQYGLGPASGHDLMAFQLDPRAIDSERVVTLGKRWLNFPNDLYYCFSRSTGVVRRRQISPAAYLRSVIRANTFAHFAWSDPLPAFRSTCDMVLRRR